MLLELRQRSVQRAAAGIAGGERDGSVLPLVQEALAHKLLRPRDVGGAWDGRDRKGHWGGLGHRRQWTSR